ncbi:MAG: SDR family oxidoreductase, partial [Christensenellales bacterium]
VSYNDDDGLLETFDNVFSVNLKSNLVIIEYAKTLKKHVEIVVISSSSSTKGRENITNYSASKAGLNSVVESQARVLHLQDIDLNAIIPEKINTPMIQKLHKTSISTRELLDTQDVIEAIIKTIASNNYGQLIHVRKGL